MRALSFLLLLGLALAQPIPKLPFPDNPDPSLCGIPTPWGREEIVRLDGHYQGRLIEPLVHLYDSHARQKVVGRAPSGARVRIILFQSNPKLNYYFVRTINLPKNLEGWVPEPFIRFR